MVDALGPTELAQELANRRHAQTAALAQLVGGDGLGRVGQGLQESLLGGDPNGSDRRSVQ